MTVRISVFTVTYMDALCHAAPTRGCTAPGGGVRGVKLSELTGSHLGCVRIQKMDADASSIKYR